MQATTRLDEELALSEAKTKEHQPAMEAACLLRAAQEAKHARLAHVAAERVELLRREEVLLAARRENANLAAALAGAHQAANDSLKAEAAQALANALVKKAASKA